MQNENSAPVSVQEYGEKTALKNRRHYLDNIRWMTVVVVVLYHVIYMYNAVGIEAGLGKITDLDKQYWDVFLYFVYPWMLPVLFLVSGISSRLYLDGHTSREFLKSRTHKLLVPCTIGLFAFQFIQGYINMSLGDALENLKGVPGFAAYIITALVGAGGVIWYMEILWVFSLILILVRKIEGGRLLKLGEKTNVIVVVLLMIPVWAAGLILNTPVIVVYRFGFYGMLFLLGYYVFSNEEVIGRIEKFCIPFMMIASALGVVFCVTYFGYNYADKPVNRSFLFAAYSWFGCLAILSGMARYGNIQSAFTSWMSKKSFGLYMFHYLGISAVALYLGKKGTVPASVIYLLSLVAGFGCGYLLYEIISRIPVYRWMVLGIHKKDK